MDPNFHLGADWAPCTIVDVLSPTSLILIRGNGGSDMLTMQLKTWLPPLSIPSPKVDVELDMSSDISPD